MALLPISICHVDRHYSGNRLISTTLLTRILYTKTHFILRIYTASHSCTYSSDLIQFKNLIFGPEVAPTRTRDTNLMSGLAVNACNWSYRGILSTRRFNCRAMLVSLPAYIHAIEVLEVSVTCILLQLRSYMHILLNLQDYSTGATLNKMEAYPYLCH